MKKNKILYLLLLLLSFSCCKDVSCPDLSEDELSWIPYKVGNVLSFKDSKTDSVIRFTVQNMDKGFEQIPGPYLSSSCSKGSIKSLKSFLVSQNGGENLSFFIAKNNNSTFYIGASNLLILPNVLEKDTMSFDLRSCIHHASDTISGVIMNDVYEDSLDYVTDIWKLSIKKGKGIVRITNKYNQKFEQI